MTSALSADLLSEEPATNSKYSQPNKEGIYENPEKVFIPMPIGFNCGLYVVQVEEAKWLMGYCLHIRSPKNWLDVPVKITSESAPCREEALHFLATSVARNFFTGHKEPLKRIDNWLANTFPEVAVNVAPQPAVIPAVVELRAGSVETSTELPAAEPKRGRYVSIAVADVERNPANPRRERNAESQAELVESIRARGELLQPIAVRDLGEAMAQAEPFKRYQLIFGEGRWLAVQQLGWTMIDAKVYTGVDAGEAMVMALVENLQRTDMNPMDEAEGFAELEHLGYSSKRMSQDTGKHEATIRRSLGLVKLPEAVRVLVRKQELSARQARSLLQWVIPANQDGGRSVFVARPAVCEIIANVASKYACNISSDKLAAGVPAEAIGDLVDEKLIAEIPMFYLGALTAAEAPPLARFETAGRTYTFDIETWKNFKKQLDAEQRKIEQAKADKASKRVAVATESKVSVPLNTLAQGRVAHVVLVGDLEKYAEHLPAACVSTGIDQGTQAEVVVCTQPDQLDALQEAWREAQAMDRAAKIGELTARAFDKVRKLKKVTTREMAFIVEATQVEFNASLDEPDVWARAKVGGPRNRAKLTLRQRLESIDPVAQVRLFLHAQIEGAIEDGQLWLDDLLRWVLEVKQLGLITESERETTKTLAELASQLWPEQAAELPFGKNDTPPPSPSKKPAKKRGKK